MTSFKDFIQEIELEAKIQGLKEIIRLEILRLHFRNEVKKIQDKTLNNNSELDKIEKLFFKQYSSFLFEELFRSSDNDFIIYYDVFTGEEYNASLNDNLLHVEKINYS